MMKKTLPVIASLALGAISSQAGVLGATTFQRNGTDWQDAIVNTGSGYGLASSDRIIFRTM